MKEYYTPREIAEKTGASQQLIANRLKNGASLRGERVGSRWRIEKAEGDRFIEAINNPEKFPPDGYSTMAVTAKRLGIAESTLSKRLKSGSIPFIYAVDERRRSFRVIPNTAELPPRKKYKRVVRVKKAIRLPVFDDGKPRPAPKPPRGRISAAEYPRGRKYPEPAAYSVAEVIRTARERQEVANQISKGMEVWR